MTRPDQVVVVLGTATDIGKTWVSCRLIERLRAEGRTVAARKPAQSFGPADVDLGVPTDADLLAGATGEEATQVCPPHRWYPLPVAPPMAADRLGRPPIHLDELLTELGWSAGVDLGLVETAGGTRSPMAHDADGAALAHALDADVALLVADAGLGTIHSVRAAADSLAPLQTLVMLNRYDETDELHVANREWLRDRDGHTVVTDVPALAAHLG